MRIQHAALAILSATLSISCGGDQQGSSGSIGSTQTGQILYMLSSGALTTYAVDPHLATVTPIGAPVALAALPSFNQFVPSADDKFLYILWSDAMASQHLSEYSTDSSGVPRTPAAQVVSVPLLSQLTLHPSGRFAYAMEITPSNRNGYAAEYTADVRLLMIEADTGHVRETPTVLASYGASYAYPAFLYGLSKNGQRLYINYQGTTGAAYRERSVNAQNGNLGHEVDLYGEAGSWNQTNTLAIGPTVIVDTYRGTGSGEVGYLDVFENPPKAKPLIHCTAVMLNACGSGSNVQLDPSGHYIFMTDPSAEQVQIARINLADDRIESTGDSIPMTAQTPGLFFSPDGTLVYALLARDGNLHIYRFDASSGQLTDTGLAVTPPNATTGFSPAQRQ